MAKSRTSFDKGKTGNAGGRPRVDREWKAWARRVFDKPSMRKHIIEQLKEDNRLLMWLGEQAHGRAAQAVVVEGKVDVGAVAVALFEGLKDIPGANERAAKVLKPLIDEPEMVH